MVSATADLAPAPCWVADCADLIGKPFELGARGPDAYDCYGLVMELGRRAGISVPDYGSPDTLAKVGNVMSAKELLWTRCEPGPGALVGLGVGSRYMTHVGIVLPHDRMVHVWEKSGGVCIERLSAWERRIVGFYRYL